MPQSAGVAAVFNARGEGVFTGKPRDAYTLGLHGATCSHCARATNEILPQKCEEVDPQRARMEQFARLFAGLHEFGHLADEYAAQRLYLRLPDKGEQHNYGQVREAFADSFAALTLMRESGDEGRAFVQRFTVARVNLAGLDEHYTAPALRASLEWVAAHKNQLSQMTPAQIMEQAAQLTVTHTPTRFDADLIREHKRTIRSAYEGQQERWLQDLPGLQSPAQSSARAAQTSHPAVARFERDMQWAHAQAVQGQAYMTANNPLNTSAWRVAEAARSAMCLSSGADPHIDTRSLQKSLSEPEHGEQQTPNQRPITGVRLSP